jgi:nicotinate-nucleotide pyrophosphorylase (carboxylating)
MNKKNNIELIIKTALKEDIGSGDITSFATIPAKKRSIGKFILKEDGIISGLSIAKKVFRIYDKSVKFSALVKDGDFVRKGETIALVMGSSRSILACERAALNFLQRMSGIASTSHLFAEEVKHTKTKIIDTRKTVPGLRLLDKQAVKSGGCSNHRLGLYDMFLIKDNHIAAAGSISQAIKDCRKLNRKKKKNFQIEIEVENFEQLKEVLENEVDIIMLDNFTIEDMRTAVAMIGDKAKIEASGGININTVKEVAETGIDFISVGALTHSVKALDISLEIE